MPAKNVFRLGSLLNVSLLCVVFFLSACDGSNKPLITFTLPASDILTTENHTSHSNTGIFDFCVPSGGTGSIGRIFRLKKDEMLVGWDRQFNPDDCDTSIVDWYRGAVRFSLDELNRALKGKEPVSIELLFTASGQTFEHRNGETIATSAGKNMLCASQIEIATDRWPEWTLGTHNSINGDGPWVILPEGEMRNLVQGGVQETANGNFKINVTSVFRRWRSGDDANLGFMFRSSHEGNAEDVQANDGCLTHFSNFAIRVTTFAP